MRKEIVSITGGKYGGEYGFVTSYPEGEIASSAVLYRVRKIFFYSTVQYDVHGGWIVQCNGRESWQVPIAPEIKKIDGFNVQYGIAVSYEHGCFFVGGWYQGLFCCDLQDGHVRWRYRMKQATETYVYKDYIVCAFQEIGLRKLSFDGEELAKYPMTTYRACYSLATDSPYLFIGPRRQDYYILDTETMKEIRTIPRKTLAPSGLKEDPDVGIGEEEPFMAGGLIILDATGEPDRFEIRGFEGPVKFKRTIQL